MALTDVFDLQTYLGAPDSELDYLELLRTGTEEAFKGLVGWRIESATYTEYYDGNWTTRLPLRQIPVNSITSVNVDPSGYWGQGTGFNSTTLLTLGTDYYLQKDGPNGESMSGILIRIASTWPGLMQKLRGDLTASKVMGQGNIKVVYAAGYTTIPADIQQAIFEACKELRFKRKSIGPKVSESLGEYSYTNQLLPVDFRNALLKVGTMEQIVARYRRFRVQ